MKRKSLILALLTLITGCQLTPEQQFSEKEPAMKQVERGPNESSLATTEPLFRFASKAEREKSEEEVFSIAPAEDINFYVRGLMQDLLANLQYVNKSTPVLVSSFVDLDSDFQTGSLLSKQISESLLHEFHKAQIPVFDHKVTDYMRVTQEGEFFLTRDYQQLSDSFQARYIVVGTYSKHRSGLLVNARVVGASSKAVVGSAQTFLPQSVLRSLVEKKKQDARENVKLIKLGR